MELDKNIENLLEKYFEASTTVAEEETLRKYFAQESVATHLEQYRPMFNYFSKAKEERYTKQVPLNTRRKFNYKWISVAAVAILFLGLYFGPDQYQAYQEQREAELAYQQTKEALSLLAVNFGKGTEKITYLKEFEATTSKIYNDN
ncbi:hypothetical protein MTsPCn9_03560 [Croceitalea sp. MTPC9]|uniref:hypothetical protein n=1 Tax=unclassified Croceitalea TaxID=2632280 RepID=UPI002B364B85|nr:hypothetical protein MTsPCn6_05150 [Croceitalea sp. MTPC6]GMN15420.1 hypothetical protein MTsPCn9_03560 [Croceitalea sp. MTPC9]